MPRTHLAPERRTAPGKESREADCHPAAEDIQSQRREANAADNARHAAIERAGRHTTPAEQKQISRDRAEKAHS